MGSVSDWIHRAISIFRCERATPLFPRPTARPLFYIQEAASGRGLPQVTAHLACASNFLLVPAACRLVERRLKRNHHVVRRLAQQQW
jgi:hypothetical protein